MPLRRLLNGFLRRTPDDRKSKGAAASVARQSSVGSRDKTVIPALDPKADLISVASHELKTPINVMLGYLRLLHEGIYGPLTLRQTEVCQTIERQCQAVARLSEQLLEVSRFEAGGGRIDPRPFPLEAFLTELDTSFQVLALQREVEFTLLRDARLPAEVVWDRDGISEVIGNLLSNAFRFTPCGGRVELAVHADDTEVRLYVRDTGSGIPPDQLPHVFDKFYRGDNERLSGSMAAKGTGLGLAIARSIVDAHRGTIDVQSTVGEGTVFSIALPTIVSGRQERQRGQGTAAHPTRNNSSART